MKTADLKYLLITAARNEEAFIELTIRAMVNQTVRPVRWIIVSDGSTDRTSAIVADLCQARTGHQSDVTAAQNRNSQCNSLTCRSVVDN